MREKAPVQKPSKTVDRAKFKDGSGEILWLRIIRCELKLGGGDPFRVLFMHVKEKSKASGVFATAVDETQARKRFAAARDAAAKEGWKDEPIIFGQRALVLKPIPAPSKKAR